MSRESNLSLIQRCLSTGVICTGVICTGAIGVLASSSLFIQSANAQGLSEEQTLFEAAKNYGYSSETRVKAIELLRQLVQKQPQNAEYRSELAKNLSYAKRYSEALEVLAPISSQGMTPPLKLLKADLLFDTKDFAGAQTLYKEINQTKGAQPQVVLALARCAHALKNSQDAERYYLQYLSLPGKGGTAPEYVEAGSIIAGSGNLTAGIKVLEAGAHKYPRNPELQRTLGLRYAWQNESQKALPLLEPYRAAHPADIQVAEALLNIYLEKGPQEKATEMLLAIAKKGGASERSTSDAVALLLDRGLCEQAEQLVTEVAAKPAGSRATRLDLAKAYALLGDFYRAEQLLQTTPQSQAALGSLYASGERYKEATTLAEQYLAEHPCDVVAVSTLAAIQAQQAAESPALQALATKCAPVLEHTERNSWTNDFGLGVVLKMGLSKEQFEKGLETAPSAPLTDAESALATNNYPRAIELYSHILQNQPQHMLALLGRAQAYMGAAEFSRAEQDANQVLASHPEHRQALLLKARAESYQGQYATSMESYGELNKLAKNTDFLVTYEQARVALWAGDTARYATIIEPKKSDTLHATEVAELESLSLLQRGQYRKAHAMAAANVAQGTTSASTEMATTLVQSSCALGCYGEAREQLAQLHSNDKFTEELRSGVDEQMSPFLEGSADVWHEKGHDETSDLTRWHIFNARGGAYLGSNTWANLATGPVSESFSNGSSLDSYETALELRHQAGEAWRFDGGVANRAYQDSGIDDPFSGFAALRYQFEIPLSASFRYARSNEFANRQAIEQKVQADHFQLMLDGQINPSWSVNSRTDFISYTDDNDGFAEVLNTAYWLSRSDWQLAVDGTLEIRNTSEQNITTESGSSVQLSHPYWTPDGYVAGWVGVLARRPLGASTFCRAPRMFEFGVRGKTDSESSPGVEAHALLSTQLTPSMALEIKGLVHSAKDWDAYAAGVGLRYNF